MLRAKLTLAGLTTAMAAWIGCNAIIGLEPPERRGPDQDLCEGVACPAEDACHEPGTCDPATGACSAPPAPSGTPCDDGNDCTQVDTCQSGACVGADWLADGSPCEDGDGCTASDTCENGVCVAGAICPAPDACHWPGECDAETRTCVAPERPDGTPCDDDDACTQTDACQGGACVGADPVACPAHGPCFPGVCDPATGTCANDPLPDGAACTDGDVCTTADVCIGAICNPNEDRRWAHWPPEAPEDYIVAADVVIDNRTGRTWQRAASAQTHSWLSALAYCSSLSLPGYPSGWRLPTRIELLSIADPARHDPAIDTEIFPGTPAEAFWTSLTFVQYTPNAWAVQFDAGKATVLQKTTSIRARCVR